MRQLEQHVPSHPTLSSSVEPLALIPRQRRPSDAPTPEQQTEARHAATIRHTPEHGDEAYTVTDTETGQEVMIFGDDDKRELEALNVGPIEYALYKSIQVSAKELTACLPVAVVDPEESGKPVRMADVNLRDGMYRAFEAKAKDLIVLASALRAGEQKSVTIIELRRAMRELDFLLASAVAALRLETEKSTEMLGAETLGAHVKYRAGRRMYGSGFRPQLPRDGYHAIYETDNITATNLGDHGGADKDELLFDGYHYPGKLEIIVDPDYRIEFAYTPTGEHTSGLHHSTTTISGDGEERDIERETLSVRVDLDWVLGPTGMRELFPTLDIGRSPCKEEGFFYRSGDFVGRVMEAASQTGSHERRGFEAEMAQQFRNVAQRFMIALDLQNQGILSDRRERKAERARPRTEDSWRRFFKSVGRRATSDTSGI